MRNTMHEELEESSLYHPNVTLEDRGDIVPFSGSDSRVVCPQEYFAGTDYRGSLVNADNFLFGAFFELCRRTVVRWYYQALPFWTLRTADTAPLLWAFRGLSRCEESDGNPHSKWCLCSRCIQSNEEASASRGASTAGAGGRTSSRGAT